jgi:hypothetical protein
MEKLTKGYLAGEKYEMKKGILPDPTDKNPPNNCFNSK